ncbi:heavy metal translocating P-type ATPase [Cetobacterium somerae]|uniref:heavy metal translocating P-type ATPase n=1 Tax=Cetobacterium sp. NK01 TaxID=2993530 RepID=UPI0021163C83|nr:heavy metal translocating P-type ATPase [Cetobacterium sp. NK01]MCQ8211587.1 heavy metal translocating P-type ATPase [Cetobacterium sp. NK01]
MKKEYEIVNLHCGGCASKIQYELDRVENLKDVNVDFYSKKLKFTLEKDIEEKDLIEKLNKIADKVEPGTYFKKVDDDSTVSNHLNKNEDNHTHGEELISKIDLIILTVGITLFVVGLTLSKSLQKDIILIIAYGLSGYDILLNALKNIKRGKFLDENFLMSIATVGALGLGDFGEAAGVMIFYKIGEFFQDMAVNNSKKSIEKLMSIKPDFANLKNKNGSIEIVDPSEVNIGDILVVKPGERVPLDGVIISGTTTLDKSALTGESIPIMAEIGTEILSGSINIDGTIEFKVTKMYSQSTVNRIIEMVESAGSKKAQAEKFITKFARYYTPIVVLLAIIIGFGTPLLYDGNFKLWFSRALIFLVISCPCALVLSVPLTFFSSIGKGSKDGILIKGGNYLERLKNIDTVVFDKTGTLTKGSFKVTKVEVIKGTENEVLEYAKAGEFYSNHPIGKAILNYGDIKVFEWDIQGHNEKAGYGINALYNGKEILVGSKKFLEGHKIEINILEAFGTVVYVAVDSILIGRIFVEDEIKETSRKTVDELKGQGINVYMLTGDNKKTGKHIGEILGIDEDKICTNLLPQDKVNKLEEIKSRSKKGTIFVGDGINDAPVLAMADIGISMGKIGSDIAIESSDIVLMNDDPYKIIEALNLGKRNNQVVLENVGFALGVKIVVMILGVLGIANLWLAIFADVGVSVLAVLNASKILTKKSIN